MVRGLDRFKEHFEQFADRYVLIGGTACSLAMEEVGLEFRATRDIDIVLSVEALDSNFVQAFWEFVGNGRYKIQEKSTGRKQFYRFRAPEDDSYPVMLELFSRVPDALSISNDSHLTAIPMDEEVSSLSAILLDDDYYKFIHAGKQEIDGLPVVGPTYLIPLKAKAWLDLVKRREAGDTVDQKDTNKHKNDVFRLYRIIDPSLSIGLSRSIEEDLRRFFDQMEESQRVDLKNLGLRNTTLDEVLGNLRSIYGLAD
jgi:hypothetical protein